MQMRERRNESDAGFFGTLHTSVFCSLCAAQRLCDLDVSLPMQPMVFRGVAREAVNPFVLRELRREEEGKKGRRNEKSFA